MFTLTRRTIEGAAGTTLAELDAATLQAARLLGGPTSSPEVAADFLRDVYAEVIFTAGEVTLAVRPDLAVVAVAA